MKTTVARRTIYVDVMKEQYTWFLMMQAWLKKLQQNPGLRQNSTQMGTFLALDLWCTRPPSIHRIIGEVSRGTKYNSTNHLGT